MAQALLSAPLVALAAADPDNDIPEKFFKPEAQNDYVKRVEMIPMRDGVKLYIAIVIAKGA